jgi:hypothetical protein
VTTFDLAIALVYLAGVVGIGIAAGFLRRRGGEGSQRERFVSLNVCSARPHIELNAS